MSEIYDVTIVGGGLVGGSLAIALADASLDVALIEAVPYGASTQPSFDERTIALTYASRRVFEAIELWASIAPEAGPIDSIHISNRGHFGMARLGRSLVGTEALGYVVPTRVIGGAIKERIDNATHIDLYCPGTATACADDGSSVTVDVELSDPSAAESNEKVRKIRSRVVVIADGGRSPLRSAAGFQVQSWAYDNEALVTIVGTDSDHHEIAYERFTRHGPLALLPLSDRRFAVAWTLPEAAVTQLLEASDEAFLAQLQDVFGNRAGTFIKVGRRGRYPLALSRVDDPVRGRMIAIGNAAHTVHPVAGQGFNLGLRDVAELAEVLVGLRASASDLGDTSALFHYASKRNRQTRRVMNFTDGLIRTFANELPVLAQMRSLGLGAVEIIPPIKRSLLRRTMGLAGHQPRLALGQSLREYAESRSVDRAVDVHDSPDAVR